jgi:hypothetical protein
MACRRVATSAGHEKNNIRVTVNLCKKDNFRVTEQKFKKLQTLNEFTGK